MGGGGEGSDVGLLKEEGSHHCFVYIQWKHMFKVMRGENSSIKKGAELRN